MVKQGRGRLCPPLMVLHGKNKSFISPMIFPLYRLYNKVQFWAKLITRYKRTGNQIFPPSLPFSVCQSAVRNFASLHPARGDIFKGSQLHPLAICRESTASQSSEYQSFPILFNNKKMRCHVCHLFPIFFSGVQRCWTSLLADINCNIVNLREGIVHIISKDCAALDRIWFMKDPIKYLKLSTFLRLDLSFMKMTLSCRIT